MSRRDRQLERILDAGAEILAERGFFGCTMRDVSARSKVSTANLYRYVRGKEELLYLVESRLLERAIASAEAAQAVRGADKQVKSFVTDHIRRVLAWPAEARLLHGGTSPLPDHLRRRIDAMRAQYMEIVRGILDGVARRKGERRTESERRVQLLLGMADRVALDGAYQTPQPRPDRLAKPVLDFFLVGVGRKRRRER
jgi:AcrR family transcriptional regulator